MAVDEGWYNRKGSKWKTMPDLMLRYRSASFLGKLYAPECLMGMQTVEELHDISPRQVKDVTPKPENISIKTPDQANSGESKENTHVENTHVDSHSSQNFDSPDEIQNDLLEKVNLIRKHSIGEPIDPSNYGLIPLSKLTLDIHNLNTKKQADVVQIETRIQKWKTVLKGLSPGQESPLDVSDTTPSSDNVQEPPGQDQTDFADNKVDENLLKYRSLWEKLDEPHKTKFMNARGVKKHQFHECHSKTLQKDYNVALEKFCYEEKLIDVAPS